MLLGSFDGQHQPKIALWAPASLGMPHMHVFVTWEGKKSPVLSVALMLIRYFDISDTRHAARPPASCRFLHPEWFSWYWLLVPPPCVVPWLAAYKNAAFNISVWKSTALEHCTKSRLIAEIVVQCKGRQTYHELQTLQATDVSFIMILV